jgi:CRP-like cAMP-binding protein
MNLADIPLLSGLDRINLTKLIPDFKQVNIKSGEILFKQGEPRNSLYIIIDGIVRVFLSPGGRSRKKQ